MVLTGRSFKYWSMKQATQIKKNEKDDTVYVSIFHNAALQYKNSRDSCHQSRINRALTSFHAAS